METKIYVQALMQLNVFIQNIYENFAQFFWKISSITCSDGWSGGGGGREIGPWPMPTFINLQGNAAENKKILTYAPTQDHYEEAYRVWSDHYQLVAQRMES